MTEELQALHRQGMWSLIPPPSQHLILGCKWTYQIKLNLNGKIDRYKARLVEKCFDQQLGINYHGTFSPVAKLPTIQILLEIANQHACQVTKLDVSNTFLHGDIEEDVYMCQQ
ncbi:uncharacterized protein LOC110097374 [Dendrobium catenatum]|uniref:uncharacterized protein LOC110097374 n=1 Tax=Dendrobium catenatum TaxID=906689 RepID=UPI00109F378B|nr:uncharacterized protein LOC110097374 [Dendrobium catenatum]